MVKLSSKIETEYFTYVFNDCDVHTSLIKKQDYFVRVLCEKLKIAPKRGIYYKLLPSEYEELFGTGQGTYSNGKVYSLSWADPHEVSHFLLEQIGGYSLFIHEGFATANKRDFFGEALFTCQPHDETIFDDEVFLGISRSLSYSLAACYIEFARQNGVNVRNLYRDEKRLYNSFLMKTFKKADN